PARCFAASKASATSPCFGRAGDHERKQGNHWRLCRCCRRLLVESMGLAEWSCGGPCPLRVQWCGNRHPFSLARWPVPRISLFIVGILTMLTGCASTRQETRSAAPPCDSTARGVIFVADGAGNTGGCSAAFTQAVADQHLPLCVERF